MIDLYNKESAETLNEDKTQKSTLSVGVAIGKTKMPINILLEVAKGELKKQSICLNSKKMIVQLVICDNGFICS